MNKLARDPSAYWHDINKLLKAIPELRDPATGAAFEHTRIPWPCMPAHPVPEEVRAFERGDAALGPVVSGVG